MGQILRRTAEKTHSLFQDQDLAHLPSTKMQAEQSENMLKSNGLNIMKKTARNCSFTKTG